MHEYIKDLHYAFTERPRWELLTLYMHKQLNACGWQMSPKYQLVCIGNNITKIEPLIHTSCHILFRCLGHTVWVLLELYLQQHLPLYFMYAFNDIYHRCIHFKNRKRWSSYYETITSVITTITCFDNQLRKFNYT